MLSCFKCGIELPDKPDHIYAVAVLLEGVQAFDGQQEYDIALYCDDCGKSLGLKPWDMAKERRHEHN